MLTQLVIGPCTQGGQRVNAGQRAGSRATNTGDRGNPFPRALPIPPVNTAPCNHTDPLCAGKIDSLLAKYSGLQKLTSSLVPYATTFKKIDDSADHQLTDIQECIRENFASIVGACIYMSITARPDITTLCNKACKGMHNPKHSHIVYLEHMLRYLKGTKTEGLCYRHNDSVVSNLRAHLSRKYVEHQPM